MNIVINVINQELKLTSNVGKLISGTKGFIKFCFILDSSWDDLTVFARFVQDGVSYDEYLDENNIAILPDDITSGEVKIMLCGSDTNVTVITNYISLDFGENILIL